MGWDIVAIGTNHKLPINDAIETAKMLSSLVNGTISIGYYCDYEYNKYDNTIHNVSGKTLKWKELLLLDTYRKGHKYIFEIKNGCEKEIFKQITSIENIKFDDDISKKIFIGRVYEKTCTLYVFYSEDLSDDINYIGICNEIVDFSVRFDNGRWSDFESIFKKQYIGENKRILDNFRTSIFKQLRLFGCDCAYYFPDQGYGDLLLGEIGRNSDDWLSFMKSRSYLKDNDPEDIILDINDYLNGKLLLKSYDNLICAIDDFSIFRSGI